MPLAFASPGDARLVAAGAHARWLCLALLSWPAPGVMAAAVSQSLSAWLLALAQRACLTPLPLMHFNHHLHLPVRDGLLRPKHPSPAVLVQPLDGCGAPLWAARDVAHLVDVCRWGRAAASLPLPGPLHGLWHCMPDSGASLRRPSCLDSTLQGAWHLGPGCQRQCQRAGQPCITGGCWQRGRGAGCRRQPQRLCRASAASAGRVRQQRPSSVQQRRWQPRPCGGGPRAKRQFRPRQAGQPV